MWRGVRVLLLRSPILRPCTLYADRHRADTEHLYAQYQRYKLTDVISLLCDKPFPRAATERSDSPPLHGEGGKRTKKMRNSYRGPHWSIRLSLSDDWHSVRHHKPSTHDRRQSERSEPGRLGCNIKTHSDRLCSILRKHTVHTNIHPASWSAFEQDTGILAALVF